MILKEQHERPCNNYKSTGIPIPLLSDLIRFYGNVEHTMQQTKNIIFFSNELSLENMEILITR